MAAKGSPETLDYRVRLADQLGGPMDLRWRGCGGGRRKKLLALEVRLALYLDSLVLSPEACALGVWSTVEEPEPWVCMQLRRATDRLAPLAISLAACW